MRFLKPLIAIFALLTLFAACKKDAETFDTTPRFYFVNGGTAAFNNNLVLFPSSDTITVNLVISSTYLPPDEATITLSVGDTARESYNTANSTSYAAMPAAAYSFETTVTAGTTSIYDTVPLKINKRMLGGESYMLPIVISGISAYKLDTTRRVIYVHTTGSELAGVYNSDGFKTMYTGDASDSNVTDTASFYIAKTLVPSSSTVSDIDYADLSANGWKYLLSFENSVFTVAPNNIILNSVETDSFKILASSYDPVTKDIYIKSSYKNLSGDERIIEESFTLQ